MCSTQLRSQEQIHIDRDFDGYVKSGIISAGNLLTRLPEFEKSSDEKPFSIEVTYEGSKCNSRLASINVFNSKFPLMWNEICETGELKDPILNPELSQLHDHTTYLVRDFYFHSDTVYVDFTKSFEFHGLHPNPVAGNAVLTYTSFHTITATFSLYDIFGKKLNTGTAVFEAENSQVEISMRNLAPGTYFLKIQCECVNETIRFVNSGL